MGGGLNDFLEYSAMVSGGAATKNIQELKGARRRQRIDCNCGPVTYRILKLLVYGEQQVRETQINIGGIRESVKCFTRQKKINDICAENTLGGKEIRALSATYGFGIKWIRR